MADYGRVYFSCFVCMSVRVWCTVGQISIYVRACCILSCNRTTRFAAHLLALLIDLLLMGLQSRPCVATTGQFETICLASTVSLQAKSDVIETLGQRQLEVMKQV